MIYTGTPSIFSYAASNFQTTLATITSLVNARGASTAITVEYGTDGVTFPYSQPMMVPRMPLEVLPLPGVVVSVGVGDAGGVVVGDAGGVGVLVGGEVCFDFEGVAEEG